MECLPEAGPEAVDQAAVELHLGWVCCLRRAGPVQLARPGWLGILGLTQNNFASNSIGPARLNRPTTPSQRLLQSYDGLQPSQASQPAELPGLDWCNSTQLASQTNRKQSHIQFTTVPPPLE